MIIDAFDQSETFIDLKDIYGEKQQIIEKCLILFSYKVYEAILEQYHVEKIAEIRSANGIYPIYMMEYQNEKIGFYLSAIGSTMASTFMIEANWLTGAKHFIMFGSAGSLDGEKTTGKYVIPTQSYREEGMSYHYAPPSDYIDIKNADKVEEIMHTLKIPCVKGRIWTTDAFMRETVNLIAKRKQEGCIAVEMEVAGVQAVCDFYGWELYNFLMTGDVLSTEDYEYEGLAHANHDLDKLYIALEIAGRI